MLLTSVPTPTPTPSPAPAPVDDPPIYSGVQTSGAWRLLRIGIDRYAGGPIMVNLATTDQLELTGDVEVEIACGSLWRQSFIAQVRTHQKLAGREVEWVLEVSGDRNGGGLPTPVALLQLATLGDVRHLRATLLLPESSNNSPRTRSAA